MRVLLPAALVAAFSVAACGDEEPRASGQQPPDRVVQAPAKRTTATPPDPADCRRVSRRLVGLEVSEASALARAAGCAFRVVSRDGTDLAVTEDFSRTRINVRERAGVVEEVVGLF